MCRVYQHPRPVTFAFTCVLLKDDSVLRPVDLCYQRSDSLKQRNLENQVQHCSRHPCQFPFFRRRKVEMIFPTLSVAVLLLVQAVISGECDRDTCGECIKETAECWGSQKDCKWCPDDGTNGRCNSGCTSCTNSVQKPARCRPSMAVPTTVRPSTAVPTTVRPSTAVPTTL